MDIYHALSLASSGFVGLIAIGNMINNSNDRLGNLILSVLFAVNLFFAFIKY